MSTREQTSDEERNGDVLDQMVCFALYSASRATTQAYRALLEPFGLTYPQYLALVLLWTEGPKSVRQLGDALDLDSGTLSPMLRRMEQSGIVTRTRSADDERVVQIALAPRGEQLRTDLAHVPSCIAGGAGLTLDQARDLIATLRRLGEGMQTTAAR
jgi:MarR family transcriptional regulator, organic hydroperoxide resistance regulator